MIENHPVGGLLAVPVFETVKKVHVLAKQKKKEESSRAIGCVEKTIDRDTLFLAQTPQIFRYRLLFEALAQAVQDQVDITDEASAIEYIDHQPLLVLGSKDNVKITSPEDLALAEYFVSNQ